MGEGCIGLLPYLTRKEIVPTEKTDNLKRIHKRYNVIGIAYIRILQWKIVLISLLDGDSAKCNQYILVSVWFWMQMLTDIKIIGIFRLKLL